MTSRRPPRSSGDRETRGSAWDGREWDSINTWSRTAKHRPATNSIRWPRRTDRGATNPNPCSREPTGSARALSVYSPLPAGCIGNVWKFQIWHAANGGANCTLTPQSAAASAYNCWPYDPDRQWLFGEFNETILQTERHTLFTIILQSGEIKERRRTIENVVQPYLCIHCIMLCNSTDSPRSCNKLLWARPSTTAQPWV